MSAKGSARRFGGIPLKTRSPERRWDPPWPQRFPPFPPDSIFPKRRRNFVRKRLARFNEGWLLDTFPQTGCQNNILVDQPQAYWPLVFNGVATGTNEVDFSGAQHNLTWTLAPPSSTLEDNAGVNLAGDREAVRASELWEQTRTWTLEWWMQTTHNSGGLYAIASRRSGADKWAVYVDSTNGRITLVVMNQGGVVPTTVNSSGVNLLDGSMHHCVVSIYPNGANTDYKMVVDTLSVGTGTLLSAQVPDNGAEPFRLCGENGTRQYFGKIANVSFYNYQLSQSRIVSHFQCINGTWNPTTIIVRYPRRYPSWRHSRSINLPLPQATPPTPPTYPPTTVTSRTIYRRTRPNRRSKFHQPPWPQATPPPISYPPSYIRARQRARAKPLPRHKFFPFFLVGVPPAPPDHPPISGVLIVDGVMAILVVDNERTGFLFTDGLNATFIPT